MEPAAAMLLRSIQKVSGDFGFEIEQIVGVGRARTMTD